MTDQLPPALPNEPGPDQQPQAPAAPESNYPSNQYPAQYPTAQYPQHPEHPQIPQSYDHAPAGTPGWAPAPGVVAPRPTNTLAIVSLILGIVFAPAGIVTGHISLGQIKRTGESGRGLALAGTIIGYISTGLTVLALIITIIATFIIGTTAVTALSSGITQLEELEYGPLPESGFEDPSTGSSGELLDTPEKILAAWDPCDLAMELNNSGDAFYDDAEWLAAQEALAQLMDPSAESDTIRAYIDYMMNGTEFDLELTSAHIDATVAAEAQLCSQ